LNAFKCMVCDVKGNSVTLVMDRLNLSASEACDWLRSNVNSVTPRQNESTGLFGGMSEGYAAMRRGF